METPDEKQQISLATLGSGAAIERFDAAFAELLQNIADPNTDPKKVRSVVLTVAVAANAERSMAGISIETKVKLIPCRGYNTAAYLGTDGAKVIAIENDPQQYRLTLEDGKGANVVSIDKGKNTG